MSISEISYYHNGCLKRRFFFNSLPVDYIFIYATLGPTDTIYTATAYCILKEDCALPASSIEGEFIKIAAELNPIRVFLKGQDKPKYYQSLNALAFKYEVEMQNEEGKEKKVAASFYVALREKCHFKDENIAEIKVLRRDEDKTEEAAFLKSLDVKAIKKATKQLKSINVYERIRSKKNVTKEYNEEKTPVNEFNRISDSGYLTFRQNEQAQDLLHFFHVFLPPTYLIEPFRKKIEKIKSKDPEKLLEEQYERIKRELISIRTTIKDEDDRENYLDTFANIETLRISYRGWLEKFRREPEDSSAKSALKKARQSFERNLLEAEYFLKRRKI